jgi:hypothetical protein
VLYSSCSLCRRRKIKYVKSSEDSFLFLLSVWRVDSWRDIVLTPNSCYVEQYLLGCLEFRCNRETPCSNCMRSKNTTCVYENHLAQPPRQRLRLARKSPESISVDRASSKSGESRVQSHPSSSVAASLTTASIPTSQPSALDIESMKIRIQQLEEQLSRPTLRSIQPSISNSDSNIETTTSRIGGTFHIHRESGQPQAITRSVTHKTRQFGQSHWINGVALASSRAICRRLLNK